MPVIFNVSHVIVDFVCCQTLERKKRTLLTQKMPFAKGKGRGWSEDAFSSEDGPCVLLNWLIVMIKLIIITIYTRLLYSEVTLVKGCCICSRVGIHTV